MSGKDIESIVSSLLCRTQGRKSNPVIFHSTALDLSLEEEKEQDIWKNSYKVSKKTQKSCTSFTLNSRYCIVISQVLPTNMLVDVTSSSKGSLTRYCTPKTYQQI